ncbi:MULTISPECIES: MFS transporter [Pseudomonas]|uniref:Major facilitator superfamily transporter n=2 Tax=Pseudomonas TaxID=286 RepID=A0A1L7NEJ7_PSEPU|nr:MULTISPECIES: MFS transporter [Pseudomonas]MBP2082688.1 DHA1 family inner membrane transport protein [Pseudomonas sp. PvP089]MBP2091608.1 DHA1 family inner membrane transport protein [Pseudomonas sp. PvP088]MBP2222229.1 DHA1 family inner membrane transport protein [Pseudomonas putida]BAW23885.1 major facilitator superfamily transporter [Pseudomonas putida]GLO20584.1 MFS transporter [Pseudomonas putida]
MRINPPLVALAIGAFGIGVTEFAPMGMLPSIATDLGVSIPAAGLLVSAYAIGVLIGAPLMTLATVKIPRRYLLIGLMAIFTLGNLMSALASDYASLLVARVVTSLNHGAFFGIGSIVAASVVPPEKRAGAVAAMFMGLTLATIGGVPLATWFGEMLGWRTAFWGIAGLGLVAMTTLWYALPNVPSPKGDGAMAEIRVLGRGPVPSPKGDGAMAEIRVLGRGPVLAALLLTVVGSSAMFTVFTYIAPILQSEAAASTTFVTAMLVLFGVGLTLGNVWGGKAADRSIDRTLILSLALLIAVLLVFPLVLDWPLPTAVAILLWGAASFALVPPLQMRVMEAAKDAPNLASAVNIGAFNLGNAIGAALGGAVINAGLGYPAISLAGAAMAALGLVMVLLFAWRGRVVAAGGQVAA